MPETSSSCSNFVEEYKKADDKWRSLKSCDTFSTRVDLELQKRKEAQRVLLKQIKDLTSQQLWFVEEKNKLSSRQEAAEPIPINETNPAGNHLYTENSTRLEGKSNNTHTSHYQHQPLTSNDYTPAQTHDHSFAVIPDSHPKVPPRQDLTSLDYEAKEIGDHSFAVIPDSHPKVPPRQDLTSLDYEAKEIGALSTSPAKCASNSNPYNPLPQHMFPNKANVYTVPFKRREQSQPWCGLQGIVTQDFSADNPSEIDLYVHDWVELHKIDGNRYYGTVFGRSGQNEGWFHKSHVVIIPDSKVGTFTFSYVVRAQVDNQTDEPNFSSYRIGDKFDVLEEKVYVDADKRHWYYLVRNKTGEMGLVEQLCFTKCQGDEPVLYERKWYHPKMSRSGAEEDLWKCKTDTFLIRDSRHALGNFTISIRGDDKVYHIIVITHRKGYRVRHDNFKSLDEILDFYRAYPITRSLRLLNPFIPDENHFYQNITHDVAS